MVKREKANCLQPARTAPPGQWFLSEWKTLGSWPLSESLALLGNFTGLFQFLHTTVKHPNDSITAFNTLPSPTKSWWEKYVKSLEKTANHFLSYFSVNEAISGLFFLSFFFFFSKFKLKCWPVESWAQISAINREGSVRSRLRGRGHLHSHALCLKSLRRKVGLRLTFLTMFHRVGWGGI